MLARRIIAKHVTKTTVLAMLGATAVLSGLQVLFTYLGELGALKDGYGAWDAFLYVLWGAPKALYEILPISALIGAVLGLGTLASSSELIVMRSAGITQALASQSISAQVAPRTSPDLAAVRIANSKARAPILDC